MTNRALNALSISSELVKKEKDFPIKLIKILTDRTNVKKQKKKTL